MSTMVDSQPFSRLEIRYSSFSFFSAAFRQTLYCQQSRKSIRRSWTPTEQLLEELGFCQNTYFLRKALSSWRSSSKPLETSWAPYIIFCSRSRLKSFPQSSNSPILSTQASYLLKCLNMSSFSLLPELNQPKTSPQTSSYVRNFFWFGKRFLAVLLCHLPVRARISSLKELKTLATSMRALVLLFQILILPNRQFFCIFQFLV